MKIRCLIKDCYGEWDNEVVQGILENAKRSDVWERWMHFQKRAALQKDPNWFPCPKEKCRGGGYKSNDSNCVTCDECSYQFCRCGKHYPHDGECSTEMEHDGGQDRDVVKCPACCVPIHKYIGCDHIICKECEYEFCYDCKQSYYVRTIFVFFFFSSTEY
jgi:hypothetical protein